MLTAASDLPRIVIWGASGHARVVADTVRLVGRYQLVGFLDDIDPRRCGEPFCDSIVLGGREQMDALYASGVRHILIAVGICPARLALAKLACEHGFRLASAVHPRATVAGDVEIGVGTVIVAGAVVNPGVHLGKCVIVNTAASIDHECQIGDGAHIGPGAHLGGQVTVGSGAWIGLGAAVRDRVTIGAGSMIGMGAVVVKSVPANVVAYGVPAKVVRRLSED